MRFSTKLSFRGNARQVRARVSGSIDIDPRQTKARASFWLAVLSHAGSINVALSHTPIVVEIPLGPAVALTEVCGSRSTDFIVVALRDGGRGNCSNSDPKGKRCQSRIHGHHDEFPFS
jgi:hypothetical protein